MTPVELWVQALRSGEYVQGQRYLHYKTKDGDPLFCCLGVACEMYQLHVGGLTVEEKNYAGEAIVSYYDGNNETFEAARHLPGVVKDWLGLNGTQGQVVYGSIHLKESNYGISAGASSLADANDKGANFNLIADIIESRPEGLFRD